MTLERIDVEPDVIQLRASTWRGRATGYDVSAYSLCGVLVDTAFPGVRPEILDAARTLAPRGVVVTHWHDDHAGNVPALVAAGLSMAMHVHCEAALRRRPPIRAYRHAVWGRTPRLTAPLMQFDTAPLQLIDTPGHTTDHIVAWDPERRIMASGDLFLGVKVRVAHSHESPARLVRSLRTVVALEPRLLLDAHRGPVFNATSALRSKIAWLDETIGRIATLAVHGVNASEIRRQVLGSEPFVGVISTGEYSKESFVHAVLRDRIEMP